MLRHVILDTSTEKKGISIIDLSAWFQNHGLCAENILCAGVWHIEIKKNTSKPWNRLIFLSNIKIQHKFEYDLNAILSDLIYTRVLEPSSKSSSFWAAKQFLEPPTYELHDVYRALSVLASVSLCWLLRQHISTGVVIRCFDHKLIACYTPQRDIWLFEQYRNPTAPLVLFINSLEMFIFSLWGQTPLTF